MIVFVLRAIRYSISGRARLMLIVITDYFAIYVGIFGAMASHNHITGQSRRVVFAPFVSIDSPFVGNDELPVVL